MFILYIPEGVHINDMENIKYTFEKLDLARVRDVVFVPLKSLNDLNEQDKKEAPEEVPEEMT